MKDVSGVIMAMDRHWGQPFWKGLSIFFAGRKVAGGFLKRNLSLMPYLLPMQ